MPFDAENPHCLTPRPAAGETGAAMSLEQCLGAALELPGIDAAACSQLLERVADGRFVLAVAGEFNRGKSSIVNALLGAAVLPVAVVPLTSVPTMIRHGARGAVTVHFVDGSEREIAPAELPDFVTERGNPGNAKGVDHVAIDHPSPWLGAGIRLVDTPGIGSIHRHNTDVARLFVPQADAVLFVASADQPLGAAELEFLADIRRHAGKVVCLLNKTDLLSGDELREAEAFAAQAVRGALGADVPLIALSARQAIEGYSRRDAGLVAHSGLPALQHTLQRLLGAERQAVWVKALGGALLRILARARLGVGIEMQSLFAPVEQMRARLETFERSKHQALQALADDDTLVAAEARKLVKERIEPALDGFRRDLHARLAAGVAERCDRLGALSGRRLQEELERYVVDAVRTAYDDWRAARDAELAREWEALTARYWRHVESIADELLACSAELFSLPYEAVRDATPRQAPSHLRYKFWHEPSSLVLLGASFAARLPRVLGAPLIRRRALRRAADLAETQAGRVRHDFEERVKESAQALRGELQRALEATIGAIENAVASGTAQRDRGEAQALERRAELQRTLDDIDALQARVAEIAR